MSNLNVKLGWTGRAVGRCDQDRLISSVSSVGPLGCANENKKSFIISGGISGATILVVVVIVVVVFAVVLVVV